VGLRFMMVNMIVVATSAAISATMPIPAAALRVVGPNLRRLSIAFAGGTPNAPSARLAPALLPR